MQNAHADAAAVVMENCFLPLKPFAKNAARTSLAACNLNRKMMTMKNTPWKIQERHTCRAIVDSANQDIGYVDKAPSFFDGKPCGSVTSQNYTAEELTDRIRLWAAAPKLVAALYEINSNAAESVEWIRRVCERALKEALPQYRIGDKVRSIECGWIGQVIDHTWINGDEMLICKHPHPDGTLADDDKRWFAPADVRIVRDDDPFIAMRAIEVVFEDPLYNFTTNINGTRESIVRYYDRPLSVGDGDTDERFAHPIAIEFLHDDPDKTIRVDCNGNPTFAGRST